MTKWQYWKARFWLYQDFVWSYWENVGNVKTLDSVFLTYWQAKKDLKIIYETNNGIRTNPSSNSEEDRRQEFSPDP